MITIDNKIRGEKLHYSTKLQYHLVKFINMSILQAKKYFLPIKAK